jgi:hypothetical protein
MTVGELKEYLVNLPDCAQVYIEEFNGINRYPLLHVSGNMAQITFRPYSVIRETKTMRAYDGTEYEVPYL